MTGFSLALLTGNWKRSAYTKLGHFKLDTYFPFGAFGDDSSKREDLVPVAMERFLRASCGVPVSTGDVFVIGDTPLDVSCARPYGVRTVAVATGFHSVDDLKIENPDFVFADLGDTEAVLGALQSKDGKP
jgi:phosphoglycolate phosphatase-like HAD superfamily hydrolase